VTEGMFALAGVLLGTVVGFLGDRATRRWEEARSWRERTIEAIATCRVVLSKMPVDTVLLNFRPTKTAEHLGIVWETFDAARMSLHQLAAGHPQAYVRRSILDLERLVGLTYGRLAFAVNLLERHEDMRDEREAANEARNEATELMAKLESHLHTGKCNRDGS